MTKNKETKVEKYQSKAEVWSNRKFIITDIFSLKTPTNCHHDNSTTVKGTIIRKVGKLLSNYVLSSSELVGKIMKTSKD
jgi:hypothetical protein